MLVAVFCHGQRTAAPARRALPMNWLTIPAIAFLAVLPAFASAPAGYVDPAVCAGCHTQAAKHYSQTAMAKSFFRPRPENTIEDYERNNAFYHAASDRYYQTYRKAGKYYQLRYQIGFDGKKTNLVEKEIHYVMGSGKHARTYLHQTPNGVLLQLPVGWYAEDGGHWAMSPGYDRPDHLDFRRHITGDCMFCHNAYPSADAGATLTEPSFKGELPEGIDCQRCHGPGQSHVQAVRSGNAELTHKSILNPAGLTMEAQMELCLQCHLESTTFPLPYSLRRYERGVFSYRPGEPLADYILHFQKSAERGGETFEINHAAYRLRMSACFRMSNSPGKQMTCVTCHDPHHAVRKGDALHQHTSVCLSCHETTLRGLIASNRHTSAADCVACHMPKRRTDDVVHVVMTDHYIQRRKPDRDLLARREEPREEKMAHKGPVDLYYPAGVRHDSDDDLYLAVAQVKQSANLHQGIQQLEKSIQVHKPDRPEFYFELAEAYVKDGRNQDAMPIYKEALKRNPEYLAAARNLSLALEKSGDLSEAAVVLQRALAGAPRDPPALSNLALVYVKMGRALEAIPLLEQSLALDPDQPAANNSLGVALGQTGPATGAEAAFREAIRIQPDFAQAHNNLAGILATAGDFRQAGYHWQKAIQSEPDYAAARFNYALALIQQQLLDQAQLQLEEIVRLNDGHAEAQNKLGELFMLKRDTGLAMLHYEKALAADPQFAAAYFNLGAALASLGKAQEAESNLRAALKWNPAHYKAHLYLGQLVASQGHADEAVSHLRQAAESPDPLVRAAAARLLQSLATTPVTVK